MKTAIITGITGQDGAYLARLLLEKGYRVVGFTRGYDERNLAKLRYLGIADSVVVEECDLLDISAISRNVAKHRPDEIYNLAAQSSVSLSFSQPIGTIGFNVVSVLNLLETIRTVKPDIRFYQASSSEMYGRVTSLPIDEKSVMHPLSPYATSKVAAHWATVNYREAYGMPACCGILFNHESYLRSNKFFTKKVIQGALKIKRGRQQELRVGNIDVRRDFGFSPEYVKAMWLMLQQETLEDFIICSGKSVSLREIVLYVFDKLEIDHDRLVVDQKLYRPNEIGDIYGDSSRARQVLGWNYGMDFFQVLDLLIEEEEKNAK